MVQERKTALAEAELERTQNPAAVPSAYKLAKGRLAAAELSVIDTAFASARADYFARRERRQPGDEDVLQPEEVSLSFRISGKSSR